MELWKIAGKIGGRVPESFLTRWVEGGIGESAGVAFEGVGRKEWAGAIVACFFISLPASFLPMRILLGSDLLALAFAPAVALVAAFSLFSFPRVLAQGKIWSMEREIPSFISRLLSNYAENGNMGDAVASASCMSGMLSAEARDAYANYCAGAEAGVAFERLCRGMGSRLINRVFSLVVRSLEAGVDVSRPLEMLARDAGKTMELVEEKNSKLGMMTWMISASSGFFYPLFAAFGLVIMGALESLASFALYSSQEKGFMVLVLVGYLFTGVMLDSAYNGQVKYGDFRRGVLVYFPMMALFGFGVFLAAYRSLSAFVGAIG